MKSNNRWLTAAGLLGVGVTTLTVAGAWGPKADATDHDGVKRAVLDYVEGFYEARPDLIERGVHADLVKCGFAYNPRTGEWHETSMTFDQAVTLAARWNAGGDRAGADSPKKIVIHDVRDRTASASLDAVWGMDHMQLVKEDGQWKILHVMWQSTPGSED